MTARAALRKRAAKIRLVAMDVDGVLTAGEVIVLESGEEVKLWNSKDRLVLSLLRDRGEGPAIAWITGRRSKAVTRAAEELGVRFVFQKCHDKKNALESVLRDLGLRMDQAAFIGDDLIDLPCLRAVGFAACPADAMPDVRRNVQYVSPLPGGRGVVRDVLELVLKAQKKWDGIIAPFLS